MRDMHRTRMTGKKYLTSACIVADSPYPVGADGEEIIPLPEIPLGSPIHVYPHHDNFSTPELTHSVDPWGEELRQLVARLPAIGNLASLPRLNSFIQHDVLSQVRMECSEFQAEHPGAHRSRTPQNVSIVMFHYHASIVKAISATTFPVGVVHGDALCHLARSLLEDRFCRFSEKDLSMLQSALRACHEEKFEVLVSTARARSYLPYDTIEFAAPPISPSLSPSVTASPLSTIDFEEPGQNALASLRECYAGVEDDGPLHYESSEIDILDEFLFSSIPPTPVPDPKEVYEVEQILQHNRYSGVTLR